MLVAEDDQDTREELLIALSDAGNDVIGVRDGGQLIECLEIIARDSFRPPDLITLDVNMPGPSGLDILDRLREWGWATPVVIITSFATDEVWARAARAGAAAVIEKPFERGELRAAALLARMRLAARATPHIDKERTHRPA